MTPWSRLAMLASDVAAGLGSLTERIAALFRSDPSVAFTAALIALSAKMARADGVVTRDEIAAFDRVAAIPPGEEANVRRLFDLAKQDVAGFEAYAARLHALFSDRPDLLADVLDALHVIAGADGFVHEREIAYLDRVAELFGLPAEEAARIRARHVRGGGGDPYAALGVSPRASNAELRRAWLAALSEAHPDRLIGRGLPQECLRLANERTARINAAWEQIKRERGIA